MKLKQVEKRILILETFGFGVIVFLQWFVELFDMPSKLLGMEETPVNWIESSIEMSFVIALGIFTIASTSAILKRLQYLEGFLPVCAFCKKIRVDDKWVPIEEYISSRTEVIFSHSYCPTCMKKNYNIEM